VLSLLTTYLFTFRSHNLIHLSRQNQGSSQDKVKDVVVYPCVKPTALACLTPETCLIIVRLNLRSALRLVHTAVALHCNYERNCVSFLWLSDSWCSTFASDAIQLSLLTQYVLKSRQLLWGFCSFGVLRHLDSWKVIDVSKVRIVFSFSIEQFIIWWRCLTCLCYASSNEKPTVTSGSSDSSLATLLGFLDSVDEAVAILENAHDYLAINTEKHLRSHETAATPLWELRTSQYIVGLGCLSHIHMYVGLPEWVNEYFLFHVCVTVQHWYNNINSRLDATMIILLTISINSTCFGR